MYIKWSSIGKMLYDIVKDTTTTLERLGEDNSIHEEAHDCVSTGAPR